MPVQGNFRRAGVTNDRSNRYDSNTQYVQGYRHVQSHLNNMLKNVLSKAIRQCFIPWVTTTEVDVFQMSEPSADIIFPLVSRHFLPQNTNKQPDIYKK